MHEEEWPLCFTQADLSSLKTLARGDEDVVIIDWETIGYETDAFLKPMPRRLPLENIRSTLEMCKRWQYMLPTLSG